MAYWSQSHGVEHDVYGDGTLITDFEQKIAALLGKESAVFMPSGMMAQLSALRIWTERARLDRFGMHASSHLDLHEEEAHQALLHLQGVRVGEKHRPIVAADLARIAEPLACLLVELPMRELGGMLPSWEELEALKACARERGVPLHMDGARLWETAAGYGTSYAAIAAGFSSVYVSVYKGIGGIAGALLAGDAAFAANARLWRRRLGGTLIHQSPMIVAAAMQFDNRLAMMGRLLARAQEFAQGLNGIDGIRTLPRVPQANMLHVFFDAPPDAVLEARDQLAQSDHCWLLGRAAPADVPGWSCTEIYVGDGLLELDNDRVIALFARLIKMARRPIHDDSAD